MFSQERWNASLASLRVPRGLLPHQILAHVDGAGDEDEDNTQGGNAGNDGAAGSGDGSDDNIDAPNTGDNATVYVLLALIAIAGVALIVTKKVRA